MTRPSEVRGVEPSASFSLFSSSDSSSLLVKIARSVAKIALDLLIAIASFVFLPSLLALVVTIVGVAVVHTINWGGEGRSSYPSPSSGVHIHMELREIESPAFEPWHHTPWRWAESVRRGVSSFFSAPRITTRPIAPPPHEDSRYRTRVGAGDFTFGSSPMNFVGGAIFPDRGGGSLRMERAGHSGSIAARGVVSAPTGGDRILVGGGHNT